MADVAMRIMSSRTALLLDQPFWGTLALKLRVVEMPGIPTACTDGTMLGYNRGFVEGLNRAELLGLIAHEVGHCVLRHIWRRDGRDPQKWNIACDYVLNELLKEAGFSLPAGALLDPQYAGKTAEWVYARLPDEPPADGKQLRPGTGGQDVMDPGKAATGQAQVEPLSAEEWGQAVQQAAQAAHQQGRLPASLQRLITEATRPKVDWRTALWRFVQQTARDDYSWRLPATRWLAHGLYLPRLWSESAKPIAVILDTSGSVDAVVLGQFWRELEAICQDVRPTQVDVFYADAAVGRHDTFFAGDPLELHPCGGGGTDFRPAIKAACDLPETPAAIVYLTDGMGTFPDVAPDIPVMWALVNWCDVPFGDRIDLT